MPTGQDLQNQKIIDYATTYFSKQTHEYGRQDMAGQIANRRTGERIDSSRFNQDGDHDGRSGVDCSSLVYYSLQGAGFNLGKNAGEFTTAALFNGSHLTDYAKEHFEVLPASSKTDHNLKAGDLIMLKMPSGSQHVAIFKEYDDKGRIHFFGSQTSTGPAEVTLNGNSYWDAQSVYYGALRPKADFIKPEFKQQDTEIKGADLYNSKINLNESTPELSKTAQTLIADATHHVQKWITDNGLQWNEQFNQAAHSVASAAHEKGMTGINLFAVNGGQIDFGHKEGFMLKTGSVETAVASNTDISKSLQVMADVDQTQTQVQSHTQQQAHTQTNERSGLKVG